jgi:hypothetical protein
VRLDLSFRGNRRLAKAELESFMSSKTSSGPQVAGENLKPQFFLYLPPRNRRIRLKFSNQ